MRATEKFRKLLDELGVEWTEPTYEYWELLGGILTSHYVTIVDGKSVEEAIDGTLAAYHLTPEQAVAATVGTGTCEVVERHGKWGGVTRHCGNCGADLDCDTRNRQNFCPRCGFKLRLKGNQ